MDLQGTHHQRSLRAYLILGCRTQGSGPDPTLGAPDSQPSPPTRTQGTPGKGQSPTPESPCPKPGPGPGPPSADTLPAPGDQQQSVRPGLRRRPWPGSSQGPPRRARQPRPGQRDRRPAWQSEGQTSSLAQKALQAIKLTLNANTGRPETDATGQRRNAPEGSAPRAQQ